MRFNEAAKENTLYEFKQKYDTSDFPEPPLKGNDTIIPVRTIETLYEEEITMHHCVGVYADRIMERKCYIYSVLAPQRATLELVIRGKDVHIQQLLLKFNQKPDPETMNAVEAWVKQQKPS